MTVDIASKLMAMRKEHGLSQEELADKLGVSRQSVGKWERAESSPDTDNLILLSQLYGVSLDKILGTSPEGDNSTLEADRSTPDKGRGMSFSYNVEPKDNNNTKSFGIVGALAVIAYLVLGLFGYWHPAWIIFIAVPVVEFVVSAIVRHYSVAKFFVDFPFTVLVTIVYLSLGCLCGYWHPWWILFVTVPLYHIVACVIFRKQATIKYRQYDKDGQVVDSYDYSPDDDEEFDSQQED